MFVTAMAGNPIAVAAAAKLGVDISWGSWALAASVPGLASLVAVPWVMSKIYPPTVTATPEAPRHARERLTAAGPTSRHEKIMAGTFVLLLVLWCTGTLLGVSATTTAFVGVAILLIAKVLSWKNLVTDTGAWQTPVFFAVLVGMAAQLDTYGVIGWIGVAAGRHGVRHVVFLSVLGVNRALPHWRVEQDLRATTMAWTFLRPSFFAQNLETAYREAIRDHDAIRVPAGRGRTSFVDTRDVAAVAALVLGDPASHAGRTTRSPGPLPSTITGWPRCCRPSSGERSTTRLRRCSATAVSCWDRAIRRTTPPSSW
jgi:Sodium:sulfate symporter transmembrane region